MTEKMTEILERYQLDTVENLIAFEDDLLAYLEETVKTHSFVEHADIIYSWDKEENKDIVKKNKEFTEKLNASYKEFLANLNLIRTSKANTKIERTCVPKLTLQKIVLV